MPTRSSRPRQQRLSAALTAVALLAISPALVACSGEGQGSASTTAGPTASAAPVSGATLDATDFAAALKRPDTVILDVRTPAEFAAGHLPGAVNIDIQAPGFAAAIDALPRQTPYAVYCRSGNRSATALAQMASVGFSQAYHLDGGIGAWEDAGGEITNQ